MPSKRKLPDSPSCVSHSHSLSGTLTDDLSEPLFATTSDAFSSDIISCGTEVSMDTISHPAEGRIVKRFKNNMDKIIPTDTSANDNENLVEAPEVYTPNHQSAGRGGYNGPITANGTSSSPTTPTIIITPAPESMSSIEHRAEFGTSRRYTGTWDTDLHAQKTSRLPTPKKSVHIKVTPTIDINLDGASLNNPAPGTKPSNVRDRATKTFKATKRPAPDNHLAKVGPTNKHGRLMHLVPIDERRVAVVGVKDLSLLSQDVWNPRTEQEKVQYFEKVSAADFDWNNAQNISELNTWRRQLYRRAGAEPLKKLNYWQEDERKWLLSYLKNVLDEAKKNPKGRMPKGKHIASAFNRAFSDRKPRGRGALGSYMSRKGTEIYELRKKIHEVVPKYSHFSKVKGFLCVEEQDLGSDTDDEDDKVMQSVETGEDTMLHASEEEVIPQSIEIDEAEL